MLSTRARRDLSKKANVIAELRRRDDLHRVERPQDGLHEHRLDDLGGHHRGQSGRLENSIGPMDASPHALSDEYRSYGAILSLCLEAKGLLQTQTPSMCSRPSGRHYTRP